MLIETLQRFQAERKLTDAQFAAELGISRTMWLMLRTGQRRAGAGVIQAVLRRFPSLSDECAVYLRDAASFLPERVTDSNIADVTAPSIEVTV